MADNVKVNEGSGPKIATDEVAGVQVQRVKVQHGADGTATDVSTESPLPISDAGGSLTIDSAALGAVEDAEAAGKGSLIALLKRLRTLLAGGLPAALSAGGFLKVAVEAALPVGTNSIGKIKALEEALPAGTNAIGKLAANSGVDIGDVDVTSLTGGTVAHDGIDSGNPIKVGGRARTELPAAVAQNDRAELMLDKFGRGLVAVTPLDQRVSATLNRTNAESGQLFAALAEGAYVVTDIMVTNAHATVSTKVEILDKETVKWKGYATAVGGGFVVSDPNGLFVTTKNQAVNGKCVTTGADVDITISAYRIPA